MQKLLTGAAIILLAATGWITAETIQHRNQPVTFNGTGIMHGIVTDAVTGSPIADAQIALNNVHWYSTDSTGQFRIEQLPAGDYTLLTKATGYADKTTSCTLADKEHKTIHISMELKGVDIADTTTVYPEPMVDAVSNDRYRQKTDKKAETLTNAYGAVAGQLDEYVAFEGYDAEEQPEHFNTEGYDAIFENGFKDAISNPLSTFSIDVDNASYANIRRFITYGQNIPKDAVRIEEMVNYFDYTYPRPTGNEPFAVQYELSDCPWNNDNDLLMIGIQGKDIDYSTASPSNLVFLIDVSGSMSAENKLPLVQKSLNHLVDNLRPTDRVALVVYAGAAGEVLPSTPCSNKAAIKQAINNLQSGGSTAGGQGIQLAYDIAVKNLIPEGNNRVIMCTDGDFNVGMSSDAEMTRLIEDKRKSGVFITVCGFGMGNYKDSKLEKIADNGNGSYYYIDTENEAEKVFGTDMRGTLFTIAKDVKIQVEFNPVLIESYRLIGYENRLLNKEDFANDAKDAGELGAGHRVTALYEIVRKPASYQPGTMKGTTIQEDLKYQTTSVKSDAYNTNELMTLKLRYKAPDGNTSKLIEKPLYNNVQPFASTSDNFRFACAVTEFGLLLRDSEFKGDASINEILQLASSAKGQDSNGYRAEFIQLVKQYNGLAANK